MLHYDINTDIVFYCDIKIENALFLQEAAEEGKEAVESPDVRSGELEPEDKPEPEVPLSAEPPVIA